MTLNPVLRGESFIEGVEIPSDSEHSPVKH